MKEIWKRLDEFPNYSVSTKGNIRNDKTKHVKNLVNQQNWNRYPVVSFVVGGKRVCKKVHRLVAETFIPKPNDLDEVNHLDGNKYNNDISNLEWCDHSTNMKHAYRTGICPRPPSLTTKVIAFDEENGCVLGLYNSVVEASRKTGVSRNTIYCTICQRNTNPVNGIVWLKVGRDISLTTSENKVTDVTGNE